MSNPKSRVIPDTLSMYLVMLVLYCLDIFALKSDLTVLGDAFYSRVASLAVLSVYLWLSKYSVSAIGLSSKKNKILGGVVYGTLFSVIPIALITLIESAVLGISNLAELELKFAPPSLSHVRDLEYLTPGITIIIYILTSFVGSAFKEFFFRGFMLKKLKTVLGFNQANLVQAFAYMFMSMPMLLRNLVNHYYDNTTAALGAYIVIFYIVHELIAGIKWGLLTRVTGATYVATFEHFLFVFISNSIFVINKSDAWAWMTHMLAIQAVSFALILVYYKVNMKKITEKRELEKAKQEEHKKAHIERRKERERNNYVDEKITEINAISPEQYKDIVGETNQKRRRSHHTSERAQRRNEQHSERNKELLENVSTADASKRTSEFLDTRMQKSHHSHHRSAPVADDKIESFGGDVSSHHRTESKHHHTHRQRDEVVDAANSGKIESFSADEISRRTEEYLGTQSIERKTPKHPHPHDKIARDSRLTPEQLDKANADKMESFGEDSIDSFLKNFSDDMTKPSRHHRRSSSAAQEQTDDKYSDLNENFNADDFLREFKEKEERRKSGVQTASSAHHHHHRHRSSHHRRDDEVVSMTEVSVDGFFDEYQKTVEEKKEKRKLGFIQKMRELGAIDDSESNDLF